MQYAIPMLGFVYGQHKQKRSFDYGGMAKALKYRSSGIVEEFNIIVQQICRISGKYCTTCATKSNLGKP